MPSKRVYVATPLGFTELGRRHYDEDLLAPIRKMGYIVLDPWRTVAGRSTDDLSRDSRELSAEGAIRIGLRNADLIREADVVLAVLDGPDVDAGVSAEVGFAVGLGKRVIAYRGDFRPSGDFLSLPVNAQVGALIRLTGGSIQTNLSDLWRVLARLR